MVKVIGQNQALIKETSCRECAARLQYTLSEVQNYVSTDYTGDRDTVYYISCPQCSNKAIVKRY